MTNRENNGPSRRRVYDASIADQAPLVQELVTIALEELHGDALHDMLEVLHAEDGYLTRESAADDAASLADAAAGLAAALRDPVATTADIIHSLHLAHLMLRPSVGTPIPFLVRVLCHSPTVDEAEDRAENAAAELRSFCTRVGKPSSHGDWTAVEILSAITGHFRTMRMCAEATDEL